MKSRNSTIDLIKIILAFLIVCVHFQTFIPRYIIVPLARFAVPLFFLYSGYFVGVSNKDKTERAVANIKSTLKYMLFGMCVGVFCAIVAGLFNGQHLEEIVDSLFYANFIKEFVFMNIAPGHAAGGGHIWFIIALFFVALAHYLFVKFNKTKLYPFIAVVLLIMSLLLGQYSRVFGWGNFPTDYTQNAIFTGFPFFAAGFCAGQKKLQIKSSLKHLLLAVGIAFIALQVVELNFLLPKPIPHYSVGGDMFIGSVFAALCIFVWSISMNWSANLKFIDAKLSFNIYLFHMFIGGLLATIDPNGQWLAIATFVTTFAFCKLLFYISVYFNKRNSKIEKI